MENTHFSSSHSTLTKIEHMLDNKRSLNTLIYEKILIYLGIEEDFLNLTKAIYINQIKKLTAKFILNIECFIVFYLKSVLKQRCPFSPLLFSIALEILAQEDKKKEEIYVRLERKK